MPEVSTIGRNLKRIRGERGLSQEGLAHRALLSRDLICKLEQGRRSSCRITSLMRLANSLDVELTELTGKRERLGTDRDGGSVLAIRDALLSPSLLPGLPGLDADDSGEPTPLPELEAAVSVAWDAYWRGDFGPVVASIPELILEARLAHRSLGVAATPALAQAYHLAASLLVDFGKTDLAAISAERGIVAAAKGDSELQWATVQRTYGWVLLGQARPAEAERLAVKIAGQMTPSFDAPAAEVATWANMLITALWPAVAAGKDPSDYITMANAAAVRIGRPIKVCQVTFSPAKVGMQAVHVWATLKEPSRAFEAAKSVRTSDLPRISHGTHLLDLAQAHVDARQPRAASARLESALEMVPVWFRHQPLARSLVGDVREMEPRSTPAVRRLARAVSLD